MSSTDEVLRAAAEALSHWRDDVVGVELLSATENLVCGARTGDGDRLVVRLHRPGYTSLTELRSEVVWVDALAGSGLAVPVPLALPAGDHHVEVGVGAERRFASVVSWVAGRPLAESLDDATDSNIAGWYRSLGEAAAHIRRHGLQDKYRSGRQEAGEGGDITGGGVVGDFLRGADISYFLLFYPHTAVYGYRLNLPTS